MTIAGHICTSAPTVRSRQTDARESSGTTCVEVHEILPASFHVRWTAALSSAAGRRAADPQAGTDRLAAMVIRVDFLDPQRSECSVQAWTEIGSQRSVVLAEHVRACDVCRDDSFLHVDVHERAGGRARRILALTIRAIDGRVVFAGSALLAEAGFPPGGFDPPRAEWNE